MLKVCKTSAYFILLQDKVVFYIRNRLYKHLRSASFVQNLEFRHILLFAYMLVLVLSLFYMASPVRDVNVFVSLDRFWNFFFWYGFYFPPFIFRSVFLLTCVNITKTRERGKENSTGLSPVYLIRATSSKPQSSLSHCYRIHNNMVLIRLGEIKLPNAINRCRLFPCCKYA